MRSFVRRVVIPCGLLATACSTPPGAGPARSSASAGEESPPERSDGAGALPDGPLPDRAQGLTPFTPENFESAGLTGELACSFSRSHGGEVLFLGSGDVDPDAGADGVVVVDGTLRRLAMEGTGGYDALANGARLVGSGVRVTLERTSRVALEEDPPIAGESPAYPGRMTVALEGTQDVVVEGIFECGP